MDNKKALSWDWAENNTREDKLTTQTRQIALDLGADPVSAATGAALRMLSATSGAKAIIEIGSGTGVSGLYLLQGITQNGVLTCIESEAEYLRHAKAAFNAYAPSKQFRLINDRALNVLPRMAKASYDMVVIDGDVKEISTYIRYAKTMLRRGGCLVILHAMWEDKMGDPARREPDTVAMRSAINAFLADEDFISNILTCGDGMAVGILK